MRFVSSWKVPTQGDTSSLWEIDGCHRNFDIECDVVYVNSLGQE